LLEKLIPSGEGFDGVLTSLYEAAYPRYFNEDKRKLLRRNKPFQLFFTHSQHLLQALQNVRHVIRESYGQQIDAATEELKQPVNVGTLGPNHLRAIVMYALENHLVVAVLLLETLRRGTAEQKLRMIAELYAVHSSWDSTASRYGKCVGQFLLDLMRMKHENPTVYTSILKNVSGISGIWIEYIHSILARSGARTEEDIDKLIKRIPAVREVRRFIESYVSAGGTERAEDAVTEDNDPNQNRNYSYDLARMDADMVSNYKNALLSYFQDPRPIGENKPFLKRFILNHFTCASRLLQTVDLRHQAALNGVTPTNTIPPGTSAYYWKVREGGGFERRVINAENPQPKTVIDMFKDYVDAGKLPPSEDDLGVDLEAIYDAVRRTNVAWPAHGGE
jgi:hypothetical protein